MKQALILVGALLSMCLPVYAQQQDPHELAKTTLSKMVYDSAALARDYYNLSNEAGLDHVSCPNPQVTNLVNGTTEDITNRMTGVITNGTIIQKQGYPNLQELAEASYNLGQISKDTENLAVQLIYCSVPRGLTVKFKSLSDQFKSSWSDAHLVEMAIIAIYDEKFKNELKSHNTRYLGTSFQTIGTGYTAPVGSDRDRFLKMFDRMNIAATELEDRMEVVTDGTNVTGYEDNTLELIFEKGGRLNHIGLWHRSDIPDDPRKQ